MTDKKSSLTWRWMEEVWNNGRESAIDEMLDTNAVIHGIEGITEKGPAGFKVFHRSFKEQFPTIHVEVEHVLQDGDHENSRCLVEATNAQGQKVQFTGMTTVQVQNGKIIEGWNNFDFMSMYHQLGFKMIAAAELTA